LRWTDAMSREPGRAAQHWGCAEPARVSRFQSHFLQNNRVFHSTGQPGRLEHEGWNMKVGTPGRLEPLSSIGSYLVFLRLLPTNSNNLIHFSRSRLILVTRCFKRVFSSKSSFEYPTFLFDRFKSWLEEPRARPFGSA
jgi:hypothetical protein